MEYKHYGAIGDILKHLMLCEFLKIEKPKYYCESNSAAALYNLDEGFNKQYGIIHFYKESFNNQELYNSEYIKILKKYNRENISTYIGSPGLSIEVLHGICREYLFCDLDKSSLDNINTFAQKYNTDAVIHLYNADGIDGICDYVKGKSKDELSDTFVHLDPYNPIENEFGTMTAVELFPELANLGVKVMLWFGLGTLNHRKKAIDVFQKMQKRTNIQFFTAETILNIISDSDAPVNPGVLGCGIIVCNMSSYSIESLKNYGPILEYAYQDTIIDNKYDGSLKFIFNRML